MNKKIWTCKVGEVEVGKLSFGADAAMRKAVKEAYFDLTGEYPVFVFSGWGGELTDSERAIVDLDKIEIKEK